MKNIFEILFIGLISVTSLSQALAQSHISSGGYKCRLVPISMKKGTEAKVCPACAKQSAAKEAKEAESRKFADEQATTAANLAKAAKARAVKAPAAAGTSLLINGTPTKKPAKAAPIVVKEDADKTILIGMSTKLTYGKGYFVNEKEEVILKDDRWNRAHTIRDISYTATAPTNIGLVKVGDPGLSGDNAKAPFYYNLVNSKGAHLLEDGVTAYIMHIKDGWFILTNHDNSYALYNSSSKKKIPLKYTGPDDINPWSQNHYLPVFSKQEVIEETGLKERNVYIHPPQTLKEKMLKSGLLTEAKIASYKFVLLHATSRIRYLSTGMSKPDEYKILMFGMKQNNQLEEVALN